MTTKQTQEMRDRLRIRLEKEYPDGDVPQTIAAKKIGINQRSLKRWGVFPYQLGRRNYCRIDQVLAAMYARRGLS